jgi:3-oxoacid CoA-transferase B subunit
MNPLTREQMAWRAAQDLMEGDYVNLGIGIPTLAASFVPPGREVIFHSENGILGMGPKPEPGQTPTWSMPARTRRHWSPAAASSTTPTRF